MPEQATRAGYAGICKKLKLYLHNLPFEKCGYSFQLVNLPAKRLLFLTNTPDWFHAIHLRELHFSSGSIFYHQN